MHKYITLFLLSNFFTQSILTKLGKKFFKIRLLKLDLIYQSPRLLIFCPNLIKSTLITFL